MNPPCGVSPPLFIQWKECRSLSNLSRSKHTTHLVERIHHSFWMHMFYTEIYLDLQAFRSPKQFWLKPCEMLGCPRDGQVYDTYVIFGIDQALYRFVGDPTGAQLGSVRDCVWMKLWKWWPVRLVVISFAHLLEVRDVECWGWQRSFPWSIWFLDFDRF